MVAYSHLNLTHRALNFHPFQGVNELLFIYRARLLECLCNEVSGNVAVKGWKTGRMSVCGDKFLYKVPVGLDIRIIEVIVDGAQNTLGGLCPKRLQNRVVCGAVDPDGHFLGHAGCLDRLHDIGHAAAPCAEYDRIRFCRQDCGDVWDEIGLARLPPRFPDLLHLGFIGLQIPPCGIGNGMSVLIVIPRNPVLDIWFLGKGHAPGLTGHGRVFTAGEDISMSLFTGYPFALGDPCNKRHLLLLGDRF